MAKGSRHGSVERGNFLKGLAVAGTAAMAAPVPAVGSIALIAGGVAAMPLRASAQTTGRMRLRVGAVPVDSYAEPFYAQAMGFFEGAGFDAEIIPFNSSGPMPSAAAGGALDVGMTDVSVLANAIGRGLPFLVIAGGGLYSTAESTTVLCVQKSSPIQRAQQFEGQTIAVSSLVSLSSTGVKAWLVRNGADLAKIKLVEMPPPEMPAALNRGVVGGAFIAEPVLTQALLTVRPLANAYDAIAPRLSLNNWFTTKDWLAQNPDAATRLVRCIYDTARWANQHRDESAVILAKVAKLEIDQIRRMRRAVYATTLDAATMQPVLDAAYTYKTIDHRVIAGDLTAKLQH
jgi:NitT/TauT family transport system substrate-binding protein